MSTPEELAAKLKAIVADSPKFKVEEPVKVEKPQMPTVNNPQLEALIKGETKKNEERNKTKLKFSEPDPTAETVTRAVMKARLNREVVLAILKNHGMDSQQAEKAYIQLTEL